MDQFDPIFFTPPSGPTKGPRTLFKGGGKKPKSQPPPPVFTPPPPVIEDTQAKAEDTADQLRRRQGRASTILSQQGTDQGTGAPAVGTKTLLGS